MNARTATADLRNEHRRILDVAGVLERVLDAGLDPPDLPTMAGCVEFLRLFADACHHGKEEDLLFPELIEHGMPDQEGPIAVMLYEHRVGRALVKRMAAALEGMEGGDAASGEEFEAAGRDYVALIRNHILKEDDVLFEIADGMIRGPACQRLCRRYHDEGGRRFDGKTPADLEALASSLVEAYPP